MRLLTLILATILTLQLKANVHYIDFSQISNDKQLKEQFEMIKDNVHFYNHWAPQWNHEQSKEEVVAFLEQSYTDFTNIKSKNTELSLLLGTISHYLYNLDKTDFHQKVIDNFSKAIAAKPKDYRAYWFLGFHFSLSNNPNEAITNFLTAQKNLPKDEPSEFWENYAFASALANMPSHSIFAMDRVKELTRSEGYFEKQLGETIRNRIKEIDKNQNYDKEELWSAKSEKMITFLSRPLGLKLLVDSTWNLSVYDYNKGQSAFILKPTPVHNKKGREISYTIAIIMKTANSNEDLDGFINNFVSNYPSKSKIKFSDKYDKMVAYEIIDKTMYKEIGGGHLYMVGIERDAPKYPGLLLENPVSIPEGNSEELTFYTASESYDRFEGKIFYAILLDSCEDIHKNTFAVFKEFFEKYLIIE
jgi:tetratricopeptide (TPR) repeat protein